MTSPNTIRNEDLTDLSGVLDQALQGITDTVGNIDADDLDDLLQSIADNTLGIEPIPDTLLSDTPRTRPPAIGRVNPGTSQRTITRPTGSIRSGIRGAPRYAARKSPRNRIPLSPQIRVLNRSTPSTERRSLNNRSSSDTPATNSEY